MQEVTLIQFSQVIGELEKAADIDEVHASWEKHKPDLGDDPDYLKAVRDKLSSFKLSERQTAECINWLPNPAQSLNIIIVPDLCGRINNTVNNPG
ncbi:hypothetical protein FO440_22195 [Mucilaginibacter corticis]|uniref:Uncharacterized protein n=1 Tax=Mucilaginibacter corticis TaxID=2597670 RepID=A0A556M9E7_9SPHI|nr:hypothetical protein [Mucilaginibacter corticis]TSJ36544.1 hypothetical protein FO440_22195 [Mucilaginibacter corticis]